jgi:hypothetical protein
METAHLRPTLTTRQTKPRPGWVQAPSSGVSLVAGDFNRDGKLDFAVAGGAFVYIFLGNGDGTFVSAASYNTGSSPASIVSEDFNRDGNQI